MFQQPLEKSSSISHAELFVSRTYESDLQERQFCHSVIGCKSQRAKQNNSKKDKAYQQTSSLVNLH